MFDKNNTGTKGRVTQTLNSTPFLTIYLAEELTLSKGQGHIVPGANATRSAFEILQLPNLHPGGHAVKGRTSLVSLL